VECCKDSELNYADASPLYITALLAECNVSPGMVFYISEQTEQRATFHRLTIAEKHLPLFRLAILFVPLSVLSNFLTENICAAVDCRHCRLLARRLTSIDTIQAHDAELP
jgi:hypothetical protein